MSSVKILVEGPTEVLFVNEVLKPYFYGKGVFVKPFLFQEGGGVRKYPRSQKEILNTIGLVQSWVAASSAAWGWQSSKSGATIPKTFGFEAATHNRATNQCYPKSGLFEPCHTIKSDRSCFCTTLVDFYGLPRDWPGREDADSHRAYLDKATTVEKALFTDICAQLDSSFDRSRFIPYVQMHEFEALLFSDTSILAASNSKVSAQLECVLQSFSCPEEINDNYNTCPSRRIEQHIDNYVKTVDGIIAARKIGLEKMRQECPHFNGWVEKLEDIGSQ